ncbi:MAG: DUF4870 domain-containing protein [Mojavia pulchra JT2-VF2]|jgi:uncharacterized Tic20 family protein|uniref:DUF4870 domain-containing protein n=1 Tax=Mojavia pulchra JT2-VF2 TaxID=287848 RepID=A0A951ULM0_9NOST|nr:DUF4870 domain-containing protein [Mojavia pulchra JT2-VF2]
MEDLTQRKILSALSHGAIFFSSTIISIGIPIAILLISEDVVVKENAKEALNFYVTFYMYIIISMLLFIIIIGLPLLIVLLIVSLIMPIIAIAKVLSQPNVPYRYPLIFHLF